MNIAIPHLPQVELGLAPAGLLDLADGDHQWFGLVVADIVQTVRRGKAAGLYSTIVGAA